MITDAGQAHMEQLEQQHREALAEARREQLEADLEDLQVGQIVFEKQPDEDEVGVNYQARGGFIVRIDRDEDTGQPVSVVCCRVDTVNGGGNTVWRYKTWTLHLRQIGQVRRVTPTGHVGHFRGLLHCMGSTRAGWGDADDRLLEWVRVIRDAA